ncbi:MAG: peptidase C45 [Bacteroidetes bacterium]|jgi:isopenicillin-N N-acyltransferase like protein|nr:peptidase C45 [Bacteroidota bacterium]MBT6686363.1 peptidase C45 [Bacteroidota bacterium]MBT7142196.1 peptidase C45 [Bacteroidota bacterium]MBT7490449.1 peptidase C45 [Bacteroidota bacterium]
MQKPFYKKKLFKFLFAFLALIIGMIVFFKLIVILSPPEVSDISATKLERTQIGENFYFVEDSWLKKNKYGLWELFVCGGDFELGAKNGILTKELIEYQEEAFVERLKEMIPSDFYLNFLKYFISWFNKSIDEYIPIEYQKEIYGISFNASAKYDFIAPNYHRLLNYHAAHDIGHTLQNLNLVACTAFGVKDSISEDNTLLVGRNMDFYSGDKFAENKIIAFYKPENGYNFAFITWGALIGVLSGMNDQGLTVTLNAAKSNIPSSAKTPVSVLARKILQYASTIDEAYEIAKNYETFVAESFLIASAKDREFAIIEKSTENIDLYKSNDDKIILTNHFQGETFKNTELTIQNRKESASVYRWEKTKELLIEKEKHDQYSFAAILRDRKGKNGKNIGMGNEKAINQLIAHHSVIFKPEQLQIWISTSPYQLGKYIAYNLKTVFAESLNYQKNVFDSSLTIVADSFKNSEEYKNFIKFKETTKLLQQSFKQKSKKTFDEDFIEKYRKLNPEYYYTYFIIGEYYRHMNDNEKAIKFYNLALQKEIPRQDEMDLIIEMQKKVLEEN